MKSSPILKKRIETQANKGRLNNAPYIFKVIFMYTLNNYQTNDKRKMVPYLYYGKILDVGEISMYLGFDEDTVMALLIEYYNKFRGNRLWQSMKW